MGSSAIGHLMTVSINHVDDIESIREQAVSDEMQGGIESVSFALKHGLISLPISLQLPPPPAADAMVLSNGEPVFGVEVTRVGWAALTQVRHEASAMGDRLVEIGTSLLADRQAKPDKNAPKGSPSGDFAAIREPSEGLIGACMTGDEAWAAMLSALRAAIDRKKRRLTGYKISAGQVWLFLIADGLNANWEQILTRHDLVHIKNEVLAVCADSGFDRVLLWRDSEMMPSNVTTLYGENGQ